MIGTDNLDARLLRLLGQRPLYPSEISRKLGVVRTTIQYRLGRLSKAGLTRKTISGRNSMWQPVYKKTHNKNLYKFYRDRDYIQGYRELFSLPHGTLMLTIQGSEAARAQLNNKNNMPSLFIKEAHRIFKRKGIAMKGISNDKALELFNKVDKDMIDSHIDRPLGLKMFANDKFIAPGEVMSTENFLLLANPKSCFVLIIKDKGITKIVNDALELLFGFLESHKTFDLNKYLRNMNQD